MLIFMIQEPPPGTVFWQPIVYITWDKYYAPDDILDLRQNFSIGITDTYADLRIVVFTADRTIIDKRDLPGVYLKEGITIYNWRTGVLTTGGGVSPEPPPEPPPPEPEPEPDLGWKQVTSRTLAIMVGAPSVIWREVTSRTLVIALGQPSVAWKEVTSRSLWLSVLPEPEPPEPPGPPGEAAKFPIGIVALGVSALALIASARKPK